LLLVVVEKWSGWIDSSCSCGQEAGVVKRKKAGKKTNKEKEKKNGDLILGEEVQRRNDGAHW